MLDERDLTEEARELARHCRTMLILIGFPREAMEQVWDENAIRMVDTILQNALKDFFGKTKAEEAKVMMTIWDKLKELEEAGHEGHVFMLFNAGESTVVAVGANYEAMWEDCLERLGLSKSEALKGNMVFDVAGLEAAKRKVAGQPESGGKETVFDRMARARAGRKSVKAKAA